LFYFVAFFSPCGVKSGNKKMVATTLPKAKTASWEHKVSIAQNYE
jgi:hypothetical protein